MFSTAAVATRRLTTKTFTSSENWPTPAGVNRLETASGYGARGTDAGTTTTYRWECRSTVYYYARDGQTYSQFTGNFTSGYGNAPANYCDPIENTPDDPNYFAHQTCYDFTEYADQSSYPANAGEPSTGFGLTFPGSYGNVPASTVTFSNIAITPGSYSVVVPFGGSITITYYL